MSAVVVDLAAFRAKARRPVDELTGLPSAAAVAPYAAVAALRYGGTGESETPTGTIQVTAAGLATSYEQIRDAWITVAGAHHAGLQVADLHPLISSVTWDHGGRVETIVNARHAGVAS